VHIQWNIFTWRIQDDDDDCKDNDDSDDDDMMMIMILCYVDKLCNDGDNDDHDDDDNGMMIIMNKIAYIQIVHYGIMHLRCLVVSTTTSADIVAIDDGIVTMSAPFHYFSADIDDMLLLLLLLLVRCINIDDMMLLVRCIIIDDMMLLVGCAFYRVVVVVVVING